ncbi:MAG TPA: hypothetical protein DEO83_08320, partial [Lachnospiraceae bacterium]|nr:hypothetical protein [Lachnospiraceae bacterium]
MKEKSEKQTRKNGKKHHRFLIGLGIFLAIIGITTVWYINHMHYDIEPHEYYDVETLKAEGRSYDKSSVVYMTSDISPEGLDKVYKALNVNPTGKVAIKLSTGEAGNPNHLAPSLIKNLVQSV